MRWPCLPYRQTACLVAPICLVLGEASRETILGMSYRDELSAALARIQALEDDLGAKQSSSEVLMLRETNTALQREIRRLMGLHQEALVEIEVLRRNTAFAGKTTLPTLLEHNRGAPALSLSREAGVLCEYCLDRGLARELRELAGESAPPGQIVSCGTCDSLGYKRS